jgi:hypothetical protein
MDDATLHAYCTAGDMERVQKIMALRPSVEGRTLLYYACKSTNLALIMHLLRLGGMHPNLVYLALKEVCKMGNVAAYDELATYYTGDLLNYDIICSIIHGGNTVLFDRLSLPNSYRRWGLFNYACLCGNVKVAEWAHTSQINDYYDILHIYQHNMTSLMPRVVYVHSGWHAAAKGACRGGRLDVVIKILQAHPDLVTPHFIQACLMYDAIQHVQTHIMAYLFDTYPSYIQITSLFEYELTSSTFKVIMSRARPADLCRVPWGDVVYWACNRYSSTEFMMELFEVANTYNIQLGAYCFANLAKRFYIDIMVMYMSHHDINTEVITKQHVLPLVNAGLRIRWFDTRQFEPTITAEINRVRTLYLNLNPVIQNVTGLPSVLVRLIVPWVDMLDL